MASGGGSAHKLSYYFMVSMKERNSNDIYIKTTKYLKEGSETYIETACST